MKNKIYCRSKLKIVMVLFFLIFTFGCSKNAETISSSSSYTDIEQILLKEAMLFDDKINKISLDYSELEDFGDYYCFFCESNNKKYECMAIIANGKVKKIDLAEIDVKPDFTVHVFSGTIRNDDDSRSLFFACSGTINNKKINKLHIFLSGGLMYEVQVGTRATYNVVITNDQPTILKIDSFDKNDNILSSYPPYPPEKAVDLE